LDWFPQLAKGLRKHEVQRVRDLPGAGFPITGYQCKVMARKKSEAEISRIVNSIGYEARKVVFVAFTGMTKAKCRYNETGNDADLFMEPALLDQISQPQPNNEHRGFGEVSYFPITSFIEKSPFS
jgi:hypothetical protein